MSNEVSGTNVTLAETLHYYNGTDRPFTTFTVVIGVTEPDFLISSNLKAPDSLGPTNQYSLNKTEVATELGASRMVNILYEAYNVSGAMVNQDWIWDQQTGILTGSILTLTRSGQSGTITLDICKTSLWSAPTIFGLSPPIFYSVLVILAAIAVTGVSLLLRKRRKNQEAYRATLEFLSSARQIDIAKGLRSNLSAIHET